MYGEKLVFASSSMAAYPKSSPYAESKRAGEEIVLDFGGSVVRFCNLFGPGGHSVVDKFAEAPTLQIRGDGKQTRSYAHVDSAVSLMLLASPGHKHILRGFTATVNQIADGYPTKPRVYVPASPLDIQYAPQD
jgi:nucleoside-diphosphate-sugar epimerase